MHRGSELLIEEEPEQLISDLLQSTARPKPNRQDSSVRDVFEVVSNENHQLVVGVWELRKVARNLTRASSKKGLPVKNG